MVPPYSDRITRVPPYSRMFMLFTCTGLSPTLAPLSRGFQLLHKHHRAGPISLATTFGVSVDFLSYGYWDVSVPRVCLPDLCIQSGIPHKRWVSPFGYLRVKGCSRLTVAFRSVPRPSSPLIAKASTRCTYHTCFSCTEIRSLHKCSQTKSLWSKTSCSLRYIQKLSFL